MSTKSVLLGLMMACAVAAFPLQAVIDPSMTNAASACIVMGSSLSVLLYLLMSRALETHPLSAVSLLGFCVTSQLGALLVQTAYWTPISSSLYDPLFTFGAIAAFQSIALAMHGVCRFFSANRSPGGQIFRGLFGVLGIYRVPSSGVLWIMGAVGLSTFFFSHFEGIVAKVAIGFSFLAWAPLLIPFYSRQFGAAYCDAKFHRLFLVGYVGLAGILGIALNTRAVMFVGVATIALLYFVAGLRSREPITQRDVLRVGTVAVLLLAISAPVSDLATSMAIARQWRGKVSASEMIKTTLHVWTKPNLIAAYRAHGESAARFGAYDEHYVANPLLNRLVATKYLDNSLHFASTIKSDDAKAQLRDVSMKFVWAGLPTPVLARLGIPVYKEDLAYSMGDYLPYLSRGVPLGGHRIGSMLAQGIALFGWLFPFMYAGICLVLFALMDLLTVRSAGGGAALSTLGMLQIWNFFIAGISYEALHLVLYWLFRNYAQMILIYSMVFGLAGFVLSRRERAGGRALTVWQRG